MNTVILGATKGMGRALARQMARRGDRLFLLGRDPEDLAASAADLVARSLIEGRGEADVPAVGTAVCDLADPETFAPALAAAREALGDVERVVVTAGQFATQERLEEDLERARELLTVNFAHTVIFCEHARRLLLERGGGTLCVFSSAAGERGRKPVAIYGASKAGLTRYLEAMDHKYRAQGLKTVCVKPGFVRTGMTQGLRPPPFSGEPDPVASRVLKAMDRGWPVVYAPAPWALVMFVIRHLPRVVMRRIGF